MNKFIFLATALLFSFLFFTSCDKDNKDDTTIEINYDCEGLELNFQDTCLMGNNYYGFVKSRVGKDSPGRWDYFLFNLFRRKRGPKGAFWKILRIENGTKSNFS